MVANIRHVSRPSSIPRVLLSPRLSAVDLTSAAVAKDTAWVCTVQLTVVDQLLLSSQMEQLHALWLLLSLWIWVVPQNRGCRIYVDVISSVGNLLFVACILTIRHQEMGENVEDKFSSFILPALDLFLSLVSWYILFVLIAFISCLFFLNSYSTSCTVIFHFCFLLSLKSHWSLWCLASRNLDFSKFILW